jgi:hypothetical protein
MTRRSSAVISGSRISGEHIRLFNPFPVEASGSPERKSKNVPMRVSATKAFEQ